MSNRSETVDQLFLALSAAQAKMEPAQKNANNPFFKTKYADISDMWQVARGPLSENGLAVIQTIRMIEGGMMLDTILGHKSGQWISSEYPVNPVKPDPQGFGSALTYARRYALAAIIGIVAEDDDGNRASERPQEKTQPKASRTAENGSGTAIETEEQRLVRWEPFRKYYERSAKLGIDKIVATHFWKELTGIDRPEDVPADVIVDLLVALEEAKDELLKPVKLVVTSIEAEHV